jgi:hypothetical protein
VHLWVDLDLSCGYIQMKNPYLDLCRYQAPGDLDPQVKYLPLAGTHDRSRSCQVLISTHGFSQLADQVKYLPLVGTYDRSRSCQVLISTHGFSQLADQVKYLPLVGTYDRSRSCQVLISTYGFSQLADPGHTGQTSNDT